MRQPTGVITFNSSSDVVDCTAGSATLHLQFNIDTAAPTVTSASPDRAPDANGWYTHPVSVSFAGRTRRPGSHRARPRRTADPTPRQARSRGTCRDKAGNVSAALAPTPSSTTRPRRRHGHAGPSPHAAGWYNHPVSVKFSGTDATSGIGTCTAPVRYAGRTRGGSVAGSCIDQAGNQASATFALKYDTTPPKISDVVTSVATLGSQSSGAGRAGQRRRFSARQAAAAKVSGSTAAPRRATATRQRRRASSIAIRLRRPTRPATTHASK